MKVLLLYENVNEPQPMAVAVRLDKDIVSQGHTPRQAFERLYKQMLGYEYLAARKMPQELKPAPFEYHAIYGMSAPYDGSCPYDWDVRVWYGESPAQWRFARESRGGK